MEAHISTYGGEVVPGGFRTVQHWQLRIDGRFIADTSVPEELERWERIVAALTASPVS